MELLRFQSQINSRTLQRITKIYFYTLFDIKLLLFRCSKQDEYVTIGILM